MRAGIYQAVGLAYVKIKECGKSMLASHNWITVGPYVWGLEGKGNSDKKGGLGGKQVTVYAISDSYVNAFELFFTKFNRIALKSCIRRLIWYDKIFFEKAYSDWWLENELGWAREKTVSTVRRWDNPFLFIIRSLIFV